MIHNKELSLNGANLCYVYTSQLGDCTNIFLSLIDKMDNDNIVMYSNVLSYLRRQLNMKESVLESAIRRLAKEKLLLKNQNYIFISPYIVSLRSGSEKNKLCNIYDYWLSEMYKPRSQILDEDEVE